MDGPLRPTKNECLFHNREGEAPAEPGATENRLGRSLALPIWGLLDQTLRLVGREPPTSRERPVGEANEGIP
jgi:hypothetical protein